MNSSGVWHVGLTVPIPNHVPNQIPVAYGIVSDCNVQMGLYNHETTGNDQIIDNILTCAIKIVELCVGLHSLCSHVKPACQNTATKVYHKKVQRYRVVATGPVSPVNRQ